MMQFVPSRGDSFSGIANFANAGYANLSLHGADRRCVPFHLSLRVGEQILSLNRRRKGAWQAEIHIGLRLDPGKNTVLLKPEPSGLALSINGRTISLERRFTGMRGIRGLSLCDGWDHHTVSMGLNRAVYRPRLRLVPPLSIVAEGIGEANAHLRVEPGGKLLPLASLAPGVAKAALPGHIWVADGRIVSPVSLQLVLDGRPIGRPLHLRRRDLISGIEDALFDTDPRCDSLAALQALEHATSANIGIDDLAPEIRTRFQQASDLFGRSAGLYPQVAAPPALSPSAVGGLSRVVAQVTATTGTPPPYPELVRLFEQYGHQDDGIVSELLQLADPYCAHDRFEVLWQGHQARVARPVVWSGEVWRDALALPFLARQGDMASVARVLHSLADSTDCWFSIPPLARTMRYLAARDSEDLPTPQMDAVIRAFQHLLRRKASGYWGISGHRQLAGAVASISTDPRFADPDFDAFVLAQFGDTADFWSCIDEASRDGRRLSEVIQAGWAQFRQLAVSQNTGFGKMPSALPARLTLEAELKAGLTERNNAATDPIDGPDDGEFALRMAAHPLGWEWQRKLPDDLSNLLKAATNSVPRSADAEPARAAVQAVKAWMNGPAATQPTVKLSATLLKLAGKEHDHLGLALMVAMLQHSFSQGRCGEPGILVACLDTALRRGVDPHSPAVAGPLRRLASLAIPALAQQLGDLGIVPRPAQPRHPLQDRASALYNTLVCIVSCQSHLETRVPVLTHGWIADLDKLGIPHLIVVGGGDGKIAGDVLHLDAPDDYEGLPQKTLALVNWVASETEFDHMLKIDDDCYLNVDRYFGDLAHRRYDYFGRVLKRCPGELDRRWHVNRPGADRQEIRLDKSPEPSSYADGGSAYALSRRAMRAISEEADSAAGRELTSLSLMEDKLIGDLLARRGIHPAGTDYDTAVRRRGSASGLPVSRWQNGFYPSRHNPARVIHLDCTDDQRRARDLATKQGLWPPKIWPTYARAQLGNNTNAVELVSPVAKLARLNAAPLAVVSTVRNERDMLPVFLSHYRRLGVACFLVVDNCSDDGTLEYLADQPDVVVFSADTDYAQSHFGVAWQQAVLANLRQGQWSLVADADELAVFPDWEERGLWPFLRTSVEADADALRLFMLDLYPAGPLAQARVAPDAPFADLCWCDRVPFLRNSSYLGPFGSSPTWTSALRHRLLPGSRPELFVAQKVALLRYQPCMRLSEGLHYVSGAKLAKQEMLFAHLKYSANFDVKARIEARRGQHFNGAEEYRAYLALLDKGDVGIFDAELSIHWKDCPFVAGRLSGESSHPRNMSLSASN